MYERLLGTCEELLARDCWSQIQLAALVRISFDSGDVLPKKRADNLQKMERSESSLGAAELRQLTWGWWLALLIGVASIVAGIIVVAKPSNSLQTLAVIFGIFILFDGITELVAAIIGDAQNRGLVAVVGALSVIAGVLLIRHPLGGVKAVALLLGIWLIAAGVVRLVAAVAAPEHRLLHVGVALVLGIFGLIIVSSPHIGYATLAVIAGINFICYGLGMLAVGWAMHHVRREGQPAPRTPG